MKKPKKRLVALGAILIIGIFALQLAIPAFSVLAVSEAFDCVYNPLVEDLLNQTTQENWAGWIRMLSGEEPVTVNGQSVSIATRYSYSMFDGSSNALAYDFVKETLLGWYNADQIEEDSFTYDSNTWKNLILTIPGTVLPEEIIVISAHLDSRAENDTISRNLAPGAEDNGSGSAALLEAARVLQNQSMHRTIRLIWFTGEEQGLRGSYAYTTDHNLQGILGVINLDMYGYDENDDRCFEMHVGTLEQSNDVGQCMSQAITAYGIPLIYDYLTTTALTWSDHYPFWLNHIGAIVVSENFSNDNQSGGCTGGERNPNYHETTDTIDKMNLPVGYDITRAALAAAFSMADPDSPVWFLWFFPVISR